MEAVKGISEVIETDLEAKEKECQKLEQDAENIRKELEKCKEDLKCRMKYKGSSNSLVDMLKKQKQLKDSLGLIF